MKKMKKEEKQPLNNALADALANLKLQEILFMNIKRIVFASLFCIAVLLCAGKKAKAAFPYDMEQKPVTATSIQDGKVAVNSDENLKNKKEEELH